MPVKMNVDETNENFLGKVFYTSWGYDQTNVEFYQVVGLKGKKTVILKELECDYVASGDMQGKVTPKLDCFENDKEVVSRLNFKYDLPTVNTPYSHGRLMKDVTAPKYTSSYA
jgi:hypothetical protein